MKMQCSEGFNIMFFLVISSLLFTYSNANRITPNFVTPCVSSADCLKNTIQSALPGFIKGNPALGMEPLDPFIVDNLELLLPGGLKIQFLKGFSKGLGKCVIDFARMVGDNFEMQIHCNLTIKGKYKSTGKLLMFSIDGDGDSMIKCKNIRIQCLAKLKSRMGEDGQEHLEIVSIRTGHSYDGQVMYRMTNLIKGNPVLSNVILEFMNRNWKMVADEFGKPIVDFGITSVLKNVKRLFKAVPLNQLIGEHV